MSTKNRGSLKISCTVVAVLLCLLFAGCFVWYVTSQQRFAAFHQEIETAAKARLTPGITSDEVRKFALRFGLSGPYEVPKNEWSDEDTDSNANRVVLYWSKDYLTSEGIIGTKTVHLAIRLDQSDKLISYEVEIKEGYL